MTEETKQSLAAKDLTNESKKQDKGPAEQKSLKKSPEPFQNVSLEPQAVNGLSKFAEKERDNTQQREAVIRPQQAGKIDFKSLQNHSFSSNRTWPNSKDSPQSPSGKNRNRDKTRKSGKGERGSPQQLYRLSITNPRSNPTIGIAYPQQKVSPPKKLESSRGPVSGSYRFHVPSIPEREAELQQEELQFRCFQEGSPNLTSQSYTSQTAGPTTGAPAHQNPPSAPQQQKPNSIDSNNTQPVNENVFPDFHLNDTDTWQSPERTFRNASFGLGSQKPNNLVDLNKTNSTFMPMPFQYGYPLLEESASDSFPCDQNTQSQDYTDIALAPNQVSHSSFPFPSSSEGHDAIQASAQFGNDQVEDRQSYQLHPKPPQYMQTPHAMSSSVASNDEGSVLSTHQSEQRKNITDKSDSFSPVGKRGCHLKNGTTSQRVLIQGSVHHIRNVAQGSSSQLHVISPPNNGIHISPAPLDKSGRVSHLWEGANKCFPPPLIDQASTPYAFQYPPAPEQRQNTGINGRVPWQQVRCTAASPGQNRIEISRQLSNQQLTFLIGSPDWQDDGKPHNNSSQKDSNNFLNKKTNEGFSNQRQDGGKQGCNAIPPCAFTNKVDDGKNKSVYYGINHSVTPSRNCSYPPLHVGPIGLKMVSPYDSPSHSPSQNLASSSTCSSLSPASVNSNSDDGSKVLSPQFYKQQQDKALISSNNMNTNQHHYHSEASRGLHYKQERAKENAASFMPHNRLSKPNMDNGKGCLETYRTENHPPPPYSAHQLATSLVSANLDQLDVLLTCKQCDQNFNNLVSFFDHKQYCGQHTFAQSDLKDVAKVEDTRKFQTDHTKAMQSGSSYAVLRSSSDLHLSLLGLNKNGEIVPDNETKGDIKDDPMKLMLPSAPLPDLEMEDPKLDSLITEALNGLGYQSDNTEIDSSFIDAFVDDDLTTTKCTSTRQMLTTKDSTIFEGRTNNDTTSTDKSQVCCKYPFDPNLDSLNSDKQTESQHELMQKKGLKEETSSTDSQESNRTQIGWEARKSEQTKQENDYSSKILLSSKFSARCGLKSLQSSTSLVKATCSRSACANKSPASQKPVATEGKKKRTGGGSWSKELIHKIVQQKNKLHKLHVKGTKNMQFSLVMERVTPTVQNPTFREYDYVSDSDDDCEPVKIASQGRLSQSIRCKYTYTKECKGRIRADKSRESSWKQNKNECFDPKKALDVSPSILKDNSAHPRLRRRSSRSSTSSELSTSISICSDSINSPKSTDHTDSDSEKRIEVQRKDQDSLEQSAYEESPPRIRKESSTSLALTFTKNTKRYSTDKILLTEHKDRFTTSKCSSIICKTEETASERTMTKSTVSLARFKTTTVEIEEKGDRYGFEATEEPFKTDYPQTIASPRGSGITLSPTETNNNRESSHVFKLKQDAVTSKGKTHKKRTNSLECSAPVFEKANTSSEGASKSSSDLFPELINKVCLSPSKVNEDPAQKDGQCLIPYPSVHDQSLSFDTMFGDISVGGFENNLYPDIQLAKESFSPMEATPDKKELFESSFSPFLEQRDWNLMDVNPVLPDEISQYKEDSDSNENNNNFNRIPFALPEKLMDYTPNLNTSVSVDDLEIKRIVTELESQLQTAKLSSPPPLDSELPKQLTMSKFSPLRLDPESEDENSSSTENLEIARPVDSHLALFSEPELPWSSPLPFGLMCGQQGLHTPTHSSTINTPTDSGHDHLDLKDSMGLPDLSSEKSSPLPLENKTENECLDKSEEMLEHEIYTENLMKSLEVISDSLSSGFTSPQSSPNQDCVVPEEPEKHDHEQPEPNVESRNTDKFSVDKLDETTSDISVSDEPSKNEELAANEQQSSFESPELTISAYEHDCESSITQGINDTQFDPRFTTQNQDICKISHAIPKDEKTPECDEDSALIAMPKLTPDDKTSGTTDIVLQEPLSNIKSPPCQDNLPSYSEVINTQQVVSPIVQGENGCTDIVLLPDMTLQKNTEQTPPQLSDNSIQSPCELRDNGPDTVTPAMSEYRPSLEDRNSDHMNIGRSVDPFESTKEVDDSFPIPNLDLAESKISSPGTLLAVDSISKQTFGETSEHSEAFDLKLIPVSYNDACFNDNSFSSKCLNKENGQSNSTDNYILNACDFSLDKPLLSTLPDNPNEQETNTQSLNISENSTNTNNQNEIKYSSSNFGEEVTTTDSDQNLLNGSHVPQETIYMDTHHQPLKTVDSVEKLDDQMINDAPTPLIPCTKALNEGQSFKSSDGKTSPKKGGTQNALQGKFQCEICAMFFRTQPGLKRHKAMKHVVKFEGMLPTENVNISSQAFIPIYNNKPHPTEKALKDSVAIMSPAVVSDGHAQQVDTPCIFEGTVNKASVSKIPEVVSDDDQTTTVNELTNNSITSIDISGEIFAPKLVKQGTFSDEMLSTLKTNILQAISTDFPTAVQQKCPEAPEKQVNNSSHEVSVRVEKEDAISTEHSRLHETFCDMNPKRIEDTLYPLGNSFVNIKCENTEERDTLNGMGADLKAFFDDESTFSQLFPRNDDRKRKKCARVYGKSNKKQKQLSCLVVDYPPTGAFIEESKENEMFTGDTYDPCDYEIISVDNAKMLEMTPKNSIENACGQVDIPEENLETGVKDFFSQNEETIGEALENQSDSHDFTVLENDVSTVPQEGCKLEVQVSSVQEDGPCSPNINAEIQISAPLFEPDRDMPLVTAILSTESEQPCKKQMERKCRKRIEPGLKPKDKQYKCKVCFTWFLTLGELDFHKLSHNPSPPPTCYMCVQRKFSSREQLRDHLREKHGKNKAGVWTCGMCLKEISDVWMYNEHLREHATQFARRGQSQSSLLGMPGCFMQENAVKNFISSIMQHRPSRPAKEDQVKPSIKEDRRTPIDRQEPKVTRELDSTNLKTKVSFGGGSKHCALTSLEVLPRAETSGKNAEMHPNCKDPSRDCHHCGKQFPKPFKLQRHLVVHNLQKIFLCNKCPVSYQEVKELKDHLRNEHGETDEPDSKHTTLYTCELCADVMHVIKKSFICSTCNYTFSKKEQFDRHMEKHLAGGNKIFKFRGVVRPCKPFHSKDDTCDMPPSKKRKATESEVDVTSAQPITEDTAEKRTEEQSTETNSTSVKIEDVAEDFPEVSRDLVECTVQTEAAEQSLPSTELKEEDESSSLSCHEIQADEPGQVGETDKGALTEICDVKIEDDTIPTTLLVTERIKDRVETNPSVGLENGCDQGQTRDSTLCTLQACGQTDVSLPKQDIQGLSSSSDFELKPSNEASYLKQDQTTEALIPNKKNESKDVNTNHSEQLTTAQAKSEDTLKQALDNNNLRCLSSADSTHHTAEDKDSSKQQKKRKELKSPHSSQRTPSPTARENLRIDPRVRKKFRPSRCENMDGQRKGDFPNDYPVLTSVKDDTASNKIIAKHKIGSSNLGLHLKKASVDGFPQKKVEIVRHFNGDCKGKKSIPKKAIHPPSSRMSTLNSSFNKSRSKPGVRCIETHAYRTAESQNNLLSQLFGQRLTSFKIPLRKDTSESIN